MKDINPKSFLIGALATVFVIACTDSDKDSASSSLVPQANAATGQLDKLDKNQRWEVNYFETSDEVRGLTGWEPFGRDNQGFFLVRRRVN
jgi:hypothetical protein